MQKTSLCCFQQLGFINCLTHHEARLNFINWFPFLCAWWRRELHIHFISDENWFQIGYANSLKSIFPQPTKGHYVILCLVCGVLRMQLGLSDQSCFETINLHQYVTHHCCTSIWLWQNQCSSPPPGEREGGEQIATTYVTNSSMCVVMYLLFTAGWNFSLLKYQSIILQHIILHALFQIIFSWRIVSVCIVFQHVAHN